MRSLDQTFSSPVAVLSQDLPPPIFNMDNSGFSNPSPFDDQSQAHNYFAQSQPPTPSGIGRKRSRDEAAPNLEDDACFPPIQPPAPAQESEEDWEYGEGMTLIKPNGFIIDASSQTGTWAEEKAALSHLTTPMAQILPASLDRPALRSYKSQRLDLTATPAIAEEISIANGFFVAPSPPKATSGLEDPTVDAFTIHLGIGWSRISDDEDIQAAARGWSKFIENHYPVSGVQIRLQSKGLASYLVETREGWFLFGDELKEGRLVSESLEKTFENLKNSPPIFDGDEVLFAAAEAPRIDMDVRQEAKANGTHDQTHEVMLTDMTTTPDMLLGVAANAGIGGDGYRITTHEMVDEMDMS